jgi:hypothetical protein
MTTSPPTGRGAELSDVQRVDEAAMPSDLARIAGLALRNPGMVGQSAAAT